METLTNNQYRIIVFISLLMTMLENMVYRFEDTMCNLFEAWDNYTMRNMRVNRSVRIVHFYEQCKIRQTSKAHGAVWFKYRVYVRDRGNGRFVKAL